MEYETDTYLEKLERQNNYLRALLCLSALFLGCVLLTGQISAQSKVLAAQKIVLVDSRGDTRAELYSEEHGEQNTLLVLHSPSGNTLTLQAGDNTSLLTIAQTHAWAGIIASEVDHLGKNTEYSHKITSVTSQVGFQLHALGSPPASSNVEVTAGPVDYEVDIVKGRNDTINAPFLKLSRGKHETIFVTPKPRPRQSSGH
jgi:hypothetical protein